MDKKNLTVELRKQGQGLDFGGMAKGYTADELKKICQKYDIKSGIINLGGNVYVIGNKPDGTPWKVGVQNPIGSEGKHSEL